MRIHVGDFDVLSSGSVQCLPGEPIVFFLDDLQIRFRFKPGSGPQADHDQGESCAIIPVQESDGKMRVDITGVQDGLYAAAEPFCVGRLRGRSLHLQISLVWLTWHRVLHWSWLLGGPVPQETEEGGGRAEE